MKKLLLILATLLLLTACSRAEDVAEISTTVEIATAQETTISN